MDFYFYRNVREVTKVEKDEVLKNNTSAKKVAAENEKQNLEVKMWSAVKDSRNVNDFQNFLIKQFTHNGSRHPKELFKYFLFKTNF